MFRILRNPGARLLFALAEAIGANSWIEQSRQGRTVKNQKSKRRVNYECTNR